MDKQDNGKNPSRERNSARTELSKMNRNTRSEKTICFVLRFRGAVVT